MRSNPIARKWYCTKQWRTLRDLCRSEQPLCNRCGARGEVVDHMTPHKGDQWLFFNYDNLQTLCASCHNSYKARIENGKLDTACRDDGMPEDPMHPWNL